jgi:1-deoxy-D-xylulose-5-phosphate reductoisomerase
VVAQLGTPDMRTPIAYALSYPERIESGSKTLDFSQLGALSFEAPDLQRFRCLALAYDALAGGTARTATLNAANEIAVEAFLGGRLPFADIARVIEETLDSMDAREPDSIDDVLEIDARARRTATRLLDRRAAVALTAAGS